VFRILLGVLERYLNVNRFFVAIERFLMGWDFGGAIRALRVLVECWT
jgi:hypothetical protein